MKYQWDPRDILSYGLAFVFLSAAVYRILNIQEGYVEMSTFGLPQWFAYFIIALEIFAGTSLAIKRMRVISLTLLALFMIITLFLSAIMQPELFTQIAEVFTYDHDPTDFVLHLTYLVIIVFMLASVLKKQ